MAELMEYIEDFFVPLERNLYGHPLAALLWERDFEWEKVPNVYFFTENKSYSSRSARMTAEWLEISRIWPYVEEIDERR